MNKYTQNTDLIRIHCILAALQYTKYIIQRVNTQYYEFVFLKGGGFWGTQVLTTKSSEPSNAPSWCGAPGWEDGIPGIACARARSAAHGTGTVLLSSPSRVNPCGRFRRIARAATRPPSAVGHHRRPTRLGLEKRSGAVGPRERPPRAPIAREHTLSPQGPARGGRDAALG